MLSGTKDSHFPRMTEACGLANLRVTIFQRDLHTLTIKLHSIREVAIDFNIAYILSIN